MVGPSRVTRRVDLDQIFQLSYVTEAVDEKKSQTFKPFFTPFFKLLDAIIYYRDICNPVAAQFYHIKGAKIQ